METCKLYLIPSPISEDTQMNVITPEIIDVVRSLSIFFVENVRTARRYISSLNLGIDISGLEFYILDKNTDDQTISEYLKMITSGKQAGIISEAGCPGIADPGSGLVHKAHAKGIRVIPLTGPSSIFLALMSSGFNGQNFTFHGYLPIDKNNKHKKISEIERNMLQSGYTQVFMETPYRNEKLFLDLTKTLNPDTLLCIACDISGKHEFIKTARAGDWKNIQPDLHKKPAIFLIGQ